MKLLISTFFICLLNFNLTHAQTLGNDDQTAEAEEEELNNTSFPVLKIIPYQWVELTDPTKESESFNPTIRYGNWPKTDEGAENVNFKFNFKYFGETYNHGYVTVNGFLAFTPNGGGGNFIPSAMGPGMTNGFNPQSDLVGPNSWGPGKLPSARPPNNLIAPFWADLDFGVNGAGYLYHRTFKPDKSDKSFDHFICEWDSAGFYRADNSLVTFQLVLFPEGGIMFQYKELFLDELLSSQISSSQASEEVTEDGVKLAELSEFDILKEVFDITIGYEDKVGTRGVTWTFPISSGTSLGNELVPDWVVGTNSDHFLDRLDGRDRRNNFVTSEGSAGCFISKRKKREDR